MPEPAAMHISIDAAEWLQGVAATAGPAAEAAATQLLGLLESAGAPLAIDLTIPLPEVDPLTPPAAEPAPVLRDLAASVIASDEALRPHHLTIAGASIETDLNVAVNEQPASRARIRLTVAPAAAP